VVSDSKKLREEAPREGTVSVDLLETLKQSSTEQLKTFHACKERLQDADVFVRNSQQEEQSGAHRVFVLQG